MSIGLTMIRTLIARHRIGVILMVVYLAVVSAILLKFGPNRFPIATPIMFLGLFVASTYLIAIFIHPDSDVAIPGSSYPTHYFTLPVKTRDLVLWPVAAGIVCLGLWMIAIGFVVSAAGIPFDPYGGALFIVALLTSLQAIFWSPIGIPYAKLFLTLAVVSGLIFTSFSSAVANIGYAGRLELYGLVMVVSIVMTGLGVSRARRGEPYTRVLERPEPKPIVSRETTTKRAFRSPAAAQFWYEWRQQGKVLPILAACLYVAFLIPLYWNDTVTPIWGLQLRLPQGDFVTLAVPTYLSTFLPLLLLLTPIYGWAVGCGARRSDVKRADRTFHLFFATRPMSDRALVWSKLRVAFVSTLWTWGVTLAAFSPLLFLKGGIFHPGNGMMELAPMYSILWKFLDGALILKIGAVLLIAAFFTWRNFVIGFWTELSGSLVLRYLQPAFASILGVGLFAYANQIRSFIWFYNTLPYMLGAVLTAKLVVYGVLAVRASNSRVWSTRSLAAVVGGYLGLVLLMGGCVYELAAPVIERLDTADGNYLGKPVALSLGLLVLLSVPLNRIMLAVSALSSNRHR